MFFCYLIVYICIIIQCLQTLERRLAVDLKQADRKSVFYPREDDECQAAFDGMKYLLNPLILVPPVPDRPLLLYPSVTDNIIGVVLFWFNMTI